MKIGKQTHKSSGISTSDAETVTIRGLDLCEDLIGKVSLTELFALMTMGSLPNAGQTAIINAALVSIAEHGLVPSIQAARMTFAAAPEAFQGAVAAGVLGCGSVILGSVETCGKLLVEILDRVEKESADLETVAAESVANIRKLRKPMPGFGHPQHSDGDPRAKRLLALAREHNVDQRHVDLLYTLEKFVPEVFGRALPINVSGAIAAVLLDAGFPVTALKGVPILARTASLIAHVNEEQSRPIGFVLSGSATEGIEYDGPARS